MPGPDEPTSADRELAAALARGGAAVAQAGAEITGALKDLAVEQGQLRERVDQTFDAAARAAAYSATTSARVDTARQEIGDQVTQLGARVDVLIEADRESRQQLERLATWAPIVMLVALLLGALGAGLYAACEPVSVERDAPPIGGVASGKPRKSPEQPAPQRADAGTPREPDRRRQPRPVPDPDRDAQVPERLPPEEWRWRNCDGTPHERRRLCPSTTWEE